MRESILSIPVGVEDPKPKLNVKLEGVRWLRNIKKSAMKHPEILSRNTLRRKFRPKTRMRPLPTLVSRGEKWLRSRTRFR